MSARSMIHPRRRINMAHPECERLGLREGWEIPVPLK